MTYKQRTEDIYEMIAGGKMLDADNAPHFVDRRIKWKFIHLNTKQ